MEYGQAQKNTGFFTNVRTVLPASGRVGHHTETFFLVSEAMPRPPKGVKTLEMASPPDKSGFGAQLPHIVAGKGMV